MCTSVIKRSVIKRTGFSGVPVHPLLIPGDENGSWVTLISSIGQDLSKDGTEKVPLVSFPDTGTKKGKEKEGGLVGIMESTPGRNVSHRRGEPLIFII